MSVHEIARDPENYLCEDHLEALPDDELYDPRVVSIRAAVNVLAALSSRGDLPIDPIREPVRAAELVEDLGRQEPLCCRHGDEAWTELVEGARSLDFSDVLQELR